MALAVRGRFHACSHGEGNGHHYSAGALRMAGVTKIRGQPKNISVQAIARFLVAARSGIAACGLVRLSLCPHRIRIWQSPIFSLQRGRDLAAAAHRLCVRAPHMAASGPHEPLCAYVGHGAGHALAAAE